MEGPVQGEPGRLGAKALATPLAKLDAEAGGAVVVVDAGQGAGADWGQVGAIMDRW
jgi:N-acetylmuramoyl-L-alanine amidase